MKKCPSCSKELPDSALVCVFCKARLAAPPPGAHSPAKTMMGYAAPTADLLRGVGGQVPGAPPAAPGAPTGDTAFASTMMVQPGQLPQGHPGAQVPANPAQSAAPINQAMASTMAVAPGQLPGAQPPRPASAQPAPFAAPQQPAPFAAPQQPAPFAAPQQPAPFAAPQQPAPFAAPQQPAPFAAPQQPAPFAAPQQPAPFAQPHPGLPSPQALPPQPAFVPVAAPAPAPWQSGAQPGAASSIEAPPDRLPGRMRAVFITFGVLLLLTCVVPWGTGDRTVFSWDALANAGRLEDQLPVLALYLCTLLAIIFGAVPVGRVVRGLFGFVGGLALLGLFTAGAIANADDGVIIRVLLLAGGVVFGTSALVLRKHRRESILARILGTLGTLLVLAVFLIPDDGKLPIAGLFEGLGQEGQRGPAIAMLTIVVSGLLPLTAWLPVSTRGFGSWLLAACVPVAFAVAILSQVHDLSALPQNLGLVFPSVWLFAGLCITAYGFAGLFGGQPADVDVA